jgi:hypothetical protein
MRRRAASVLVTGVAAAFMAGAVPAGARPDPHDPTQAIDRVPWLRSAVVHHGHVVRMALVLRDGETVLRRARVRIGPRVVRIGLHKVRFRGNTTADGKLLCVQVRLSVSVAGRFREDHAGRRPDLARAGTRLAALRDDTLAVDLERGPCLRLRPRYVRPRSR